MSKPQTICKKCFKKPKWRCETNDGNKVTVYCEHNQAMTVYDTSVDLWFSTSSISLEIFKNSLIVASDVHAQIQAERAATH